MLEGALHVEGEVIVDEESQPTSALRGELHVGADGLLVRGIASVGIDNARTALEVGDDDPVGLDEVVPDEGGGPDHVVAKTVPDGGAGNLEDGFKITTEGTIYVGARAPGIRGVEHPTQTNVVLLIIVHRDPRPNAAR